jgi:hypothetical protein
MQVSTALMSYNIRQASHSCYAGALHGVHPYIGLHGQETTYNISAAELTMQAGPEAHIVADYH